MEDVKSRLGNIFEKDSQLACPAAPASIFNSLVRGRTSRGGILRSDVEVGFAAPRPPYVCRDVNGRWRQKHEFDERSVGEPCLWCGKVRARC